VVKDPLQLAPLSWENEDMIKATQAGVTVAVPNAGPARLVPARRDWGGLDASLELVRSKVLLCEAEYRKYGIGGSTTPSMGTTGLYDYLLACDDDPHDPDTIFARLRWGGQFVYASADPREVRSTAESFVKRGFELAHSPSAVRAPWLGIPWLGRKTHYFVARRVRLTLPKEISERFTYSVGLVNDHSSTRDYVVLKEVPSVERVSARLRHKFPDAAADLIEKRARKFTEKIFPLFLTREAAMLKILERDLPRDYSGRVPHVIDLEQDGRGYVRRLWMNWLRAAPPGGRTLTQLEFARQAADLLNVIHEKVGIIHLDLRLDNFVITDQGVGFVDFGSAVRVGENIQGNPLLATIFDELMRTSQIQRMLEKMTLNGTVTSPILNDAYGKVDKAVDLFYLAVQINSPLSNPDFLGLVSYEPQSDEAEGLARVSQEVLKPRNPSCPAIRTAQDLLQTVNRLAQGLRRPAKAEMVKVGRAS
jgi:hypothetical protein